MPKNLALFLGQALRNPTHVGAIAPSGLILGRLMARDLGPHSKLVVEIGPGTGSLTRAIIEAGVPQENLVLVELNEAFCNTLAKRYPRANIIHGGAQELGKHGIKGAETVVSGLPFLNFPSGLQHEILAAVFESLEPGRELVQFTYGRKPPISPQVMQNLELTWHLRGRVWANFPPASVYEFRRGG